jgi:hypothetical protein
MVCWLPIGVHDSIPPKKKVVTGGSVSERKAV